MVDFIESKALKAYRGRKNWSQQELADATAGTNKVGIATIKRIEGAESGKYSARHIVAAGLAKALGIAVEDLSKVPSGPDEDEKTLRKAGYRPLRTMIDAETALSFNMVAKIYGIPIRSQILMAPLFAALLAEGSFAWRRKRVAAIQEAAARLRELGGGNFSFVYADFDTVDGLGCEIQSINDRDLFGVNASDTTFDCGYDRSENNPFADYLKSFSAESNAENITFEKDSGWADDEGLPKYKIGIDIITQLTGGDPDAEYAILHGYVRLKNIPQELLEDSNEDQRIAWMIEQIPEDVLAPIRSKRSELERLHMKIRDSILQDTKQEGEDYD